MEIQELLQVIKKRLALLITITTLSVLISAIISFYIITPEYKATCSLVVTKHMEKDGGKIAI